MSGAGAASATPVSAAPAGTVSPGGVWPASRFGDLAREQVAPVAARWASDVDSSARFPAEAVGALRDAGLLSMAVPHDGQPVPASFVEMCDVARVLGRHCAATAMIFAMHQSQVLSLVNHGGPDFAGVLEDIAVKGLLLASATTEIGIGGDVRTSSCAVVRQGERVYLAKTAPVISYGSYADAVLVTARRNPDAAPSDQVLVYCPRDEVTLVQTGEWDTLGLRGTCSPGFELTAHVVPQHVLATEYSEISQRTMLPASHCLWSSVWLGIAEGALDRARKFVRKGARKQPGVATPAALRLAEAFATYQEFSDLVCSSATRYATAGQDTLGSIGFQLAMNNLKVTASDSVVDLVSQALLICGISGYREGGEFSLGRSLRDAHGARLMVNNDRILANSAQLALVVGGIV